MCLSSGWNMTIVSRCALNLHCKIKAKEMAENQSERSIDSIVKQYCNKYLSATWTAQGETYDRCAFILAVNGTANVNAYSPGAMKRLQEESLFWNRQLYMSHSIIKLHIITKSKPILCDCRYSCSRQGTLHWKFSVECFSSRARPHAGTITMRQNLVLNIRPAVRLHTQHLPSIFPYLGHLAQDHCFLLYSLFGFIFEIFFVPTNMWYGTGGSRFIRMCLYRNFPQSQRPAFEIPLIGKKFTSLSN